MDPVLKRWLFENWLGDRKDSAELAKNHAYLLASFDHADVVKQLLGQGNVHVSSEEEFEESSKMVKDQIDLESLSLIKKLNKNNQGARRKRRKIVDK